MKLTSLNFEVWQKQHTSDHSAKYFRQLYPFHVFRKIDFGNEYIGRIQRLQVNEVEYDVNIKQILLQERGSYKATFEVKCSIEKTVLKWQNIEWNDKFEITYGTNNHFITVFSKDTDPLKKLLKAFRSCNFDAIEFKRSLQVSDLLFRSLVLELCTKKIKDGSDNINFPFINKDVTGLSTFKYPFDNVTPFYSKGRDLWVFETFFEETAHRMGLYFSAQAKQLIVIFCNPSYNKHHRCNLPNTFILSLHEFVDTFPTLEKLKYEKQILFLQGSLNITKRRSPQELLTEISSPSGKYPVTESNIMEALAVIKTKPGSIYEVFHFLAASNLLNAWCTSKDSKTVSAKEKRNNADLYSFKAKVSAVLTVLIAHKVSGYSIYISDTLVYIEILNFQFSFHNLTLTVTMKEFKASSRNKEIIWSGKRLKPIAPIILEYAKALKEKPTKKINGCFRTQ